MRYIPITRSGISIKVDDVVHEWLNWYKWFGGKACNCIYARRCIIRETDGISRTIYLHRMVCGLPRGYLVRFRNGDSLDCRYENLLCTSPMGKEIHWPMSCGASDFNGVIWDGRYGMWRSSFDGMIIGYYISEVEAAIAYNEKACKYMPESMNNLEFLHA